MMKQIDNLDLLDKLIFGRVTPHIYAFQTGTIPNYLKVGDTYRPVSIRLKEWEQKFPDLTKEYEHKATVKDDVYFRDHAVHYYLEISLGKERLKPEDLSQKDVYYSREFFKDILPSDLDAAIQDICQQYEEHNPTYTYYNTSERLAVTVHYERGAEWKLRPNQQEAVNNFIKAINNGRTNLLMYAVMRFGKSFTSLACAKAMNAKTVLIVSAKADVREEWKKNVERPGNFYGYQFLSAKELLENESAISDVHTQGETAVIFLTLQDLQGDTIKEKHKEVFTNDIDLLIVDETHFGARAQSYGEILRNAQSSEQKDIKNELKILNKQEDEQVDINEATTQIKKLRAKVRLHLSGTPYRILMGSEFAPEDIISFVQFTDIAHEKAAWDAENLDNDDIEEWDNPYFGFPQMIRFAFHPSEKAIAKMNDLKKNGISFALSALFKPESVKKDTETNGHKKFVHEDEILDLLRIIDGSKSESRILGFLDYDKIKRGQMCRHMVMILPYCASCDAMEKLIKTHASEFKNLSGYEILNISGLDAQRNFRTPTDIKRRITKLESENKKTLTLTVNRMLTGSTVEQWDTMLYLKDTASPQEYDQAIFRLQNQYVRELSDGKQVIKECLKPQTLLVDFDPHRLFTMQEQKSLIYNANTQKNGNLLLRERIADELRISPVITMNHNRLEQVEATDILQAVSKYNNARSITDEVTDLPIDFNILDDEHLRQVIEMQNPFGSKQGLTLEAYTSNNDGQDMEIENATLEDGTNTGKKQQEAKPEPLSTKDDDIKDLENKIRTYYQRILFFAFLCPEPVQSLDDIIETLKQGKNERLAKNLSITQEDLNVLRDKLNVFKLSALDYKVQNISTLATDERLSPLDRAITSLAKFSRMSASEIITPMHIADEMVALLPEGELHNMVLAGDKLLDIASKAGEYTVALFKRLKEVGLTLDQIKDSIYAIPTSSVAYEFTRRFYEILGLNTACIAKGFTSYDLLKIKTKNEEVDYKRITQLLTQKKSFAEITLEDNMQGGETVKFGAVVGNPPYQESDGGAQASARPIYDKFVEVANHLKPELATLIIPTRWYAGGKGLDQFRDNMLSNKHISQLHDFLNPEVVFPGTNNRGGVCYFLIDSRYDTDKNGGTNIITYQDKAVTCNTVRKLNTFNSGMFMRDSKGVKIVEKVLHHNNFSALSNEISSRKPFGFDGKIIKSSLFHENSNEINNPTICYGKGQLKGYVDKAIIPANHEWINRYKVFVPRANNIGTELNDDNQNVFMGLPNEVCSETYILAGVQLSLTERTALYLVKYMKTKFARFMHKLAKVSQDASKQTYRFVPVPDLTENSPINWELSLDEIDNQLFNFYGLSEEEKQHIRNSIKDMD